MLMILIYLSFSIFCCLHFLSRYPNPFIDQLDLSAKTYDLKKVAVLYLPFINYTVPLTGIKATAERFKEFFVEPKYTLFYQEDCNINQTHDLIKQGKFKYLVK